MDFEGQWGVVTLWWSWQLWLLAVEEEHKLLCWTFFPNNRQLCKGLTLDRRCLEFSHVFLEIRQGLTVEVYGQGLSEERTNQDFCWFVYFVELRVAVCTHLWHQTISAQDCHIYPWTLVSSTNNDLEQWYFNLYQRLACSLSRTISGMCSREFLRTISFSWS